MSLLVVLKNHIIVACSLASWHVSLCGCHTVRKTFLTGMRLPKFFSPTMWFSVFLSPLFAGNRGEKFPPPPSPPEWKFNARGPKGRIVPADGR